jgi:hypothetical protein
MRIVVDELDGKGGPSGAYADVMGRVDGIFRT